MIPLGFDMNYVPYVERDDDITKRPLRLLYAGTLTQRKGLKYLLNVMKQLGRSDIELTCVGGLQGSGKGLLGFESYFQHIPAVAQHVMFGMYQDYDALVLPTVFEGFGLVIVEAMAAGLPVITTPHSMGPEVIENDVNGYVIPIRDEEALLAAIVQLRQKDKYQYLAMRQAARTRVMKYTWDAYNDRMPAFLQDFEAVYKSLK
jgi:glycosyltransferase involved in cell wall biosynthesis